MTLVVFMKSLGRTSKFAIAITVKLLRTNLTLAKYGGGEFIPERVNYYGILNAPI